MIKRLFRAVGLFLFDDYVQWAVRQRFNDEWYEFQRRQQYEASRERRMQELMEFHNRRHPWIPADVFNLKEKK